MPYCPHCGTQLGADAAFCNACGARVGEQAGPAPPGASAPEREARSRAIIAGLAGIVVVVIVGIVLYTITTGDDGDSTLGGAGETVEFGGTPTAGAPAEPSPTLESASPTNAPTAPPAFTPVPPVAGHATPEEAIGAFLAEQGLGYAGDCSLIDLDRDVGFYCSSLWEDQFDTRIYMAGLAFSEPDTWLLVSRLGARDDWTVVDFAGLDPFAENLEPPWP